MITSIMIDSNQYQVFSLNPRAGKISNEDTKSGAESVKPSLIWGKVDRQHSIEALAYGSHLEKDDQVRINYISRKSCHLIFT